MDNAADIVFQPTLIPSFGIAGLSLTSSGIISGTPTDTFSNRVAVSVADAIGAIGVSILDLMIFDDRDDDGMLDAWERVIVDDNPSDGIETIYDVLLNVNYYGDTFFNI